MQKSSLWIKHGAFRDDEHSRALPIRAKPYRGHIVATCASACSRFPYFALQAGDFCLCGNNWSQAIKHGKGACGETGGALCNFVYEHEPRVRLRADAEAAWPEMPLGGCVPDVLRLKWGGCAGSKWTQMAADRLAERYPTPVLINVGANKGYNGAAFLALHSQSGVTQRSWARHIQGYARANGKRNGILKFTACGACGSCKAKRPPPHQRNAGTVHMLELLEANRILLREIVARSNVGHLVRVHDLAASNETKRVPQPKILSAGAETASLYTPGQIMSNGKRAPRPKSRGMIDLTTLDDFFTREGLKDIYSVEIDTEGHDALVLEGMRQTLKARRVGFVEFEYSNKAFWIDHRSALRRTLEGTLRWMHDEAGYTCFMEAGDALAPISPPACWDPDFERPHWSNVVCAHDSNGGLRLLHNLSWTEYAKRRAAKRASRVVQ